MKVRVAIEKVLESASNDGRHAPYFVIMHPDTKKVLDREETYFLNSYQGQFTPDLMDVVELRTDYGTAYLYASRWCPADSVYAMEWGDAVKVFHWAEDVNSLLEPVPTLPSLRGYQFPKVEAL